MAETISTFEQIQELKMILEAEGIPSELPDLLETLHEELKHARSALTTVLETVGNPDNWDNPSSALERIGDAVDSERYPVWKRYSGE